MDRFGENESESELAPSANIVLSFGAANLSVFCYVNLFGHKRFTFGARCNGCAAAAAAAASLGASLNVARLKGLGGVETREQNNALSEESKIVSGFKKGACQESETESGNVSLTPIESARRRRRRRSPSLVSLGQV